MRNVACITLGIGLAFPASLSFAQAVELDAISYTKLVDELGTGNVPTGAGIQVGQVEAGGTKYMPDAGLSSFSGKTFTNVTGTSSTPWSHATTVGRHYYGNTDAVGRGITDILNYEANDWLGTGFLKANSTSTPGGFGSVLPRVTNHSWVIDFGSDGANIEALQRVEYIVDEYEMIQVMGPANDPDPTNPADAYPVTTSAFNVISVGLTNGTHATGTSSMTSPQQTLYADARMQPHVVVPETATSWGAPVVSGTVAALLEAGNNPAFSNGSLERYFDGTAPINIGTPTTVYHAQTTEVIRATLMAGADRYANFYAPIDANTSVSHSYTINTSNNLDDHFGAGELDVYNSYHILAGGEFDSSEESGSNTFFGDGSSAMHAGFDYDDSFATGDTATYFFSTATHDATPNPLGLAATLSWNVTVDANPAFFLSPTLERANFDLMLYEVDDINDENTWSLVQSSTSTIETTENLFTLDLDGDSTYAIVVKRAAGDTGDPLDYGLAFRTITIGEGDINFDGYVDELDAAILLSNLGQSTAGGWQAGDFDVDGVVDFADASIIAQYWSDGSANFPGFTALNNGSGPVIPEPSSLGLLLLSAAGLVLRRR